MWGRVLTMREGIGVEAARGGGEVVLRDNDRGKLLVKLSLK